MGRLEAPGGTAVAGVARPKGNTATMASCSRRENHKWCDCAVSEDSISTRKGWYDARRLWVFIVVVARKYAMARHKLRQRSHFPCLRALPWPAHIVVKSSRLRHRGDRE
jgi:hypothetical protein